MLKPCRKADGTKWELFGEQPPGGEGREGCTPIPYFKLHVRNDGISHVFTRNRRNTFCPACQHSKLCHCVSLSISSSRCSFMRKFCSLMSVRIRKKKPQPSKQFYCKSLPFHYTCTFRNIGIYLLFFKNTE